MPEKSNFGGMAVYRDLTRGPIARSLILFALPMMAGNLLQQFYNLADTLIVGRTLGARALAAVGSAYTLMTFLTSIFLGLSMGSGALFSIYRGRGDEASLRRGVFHALVLILTVTLVLNIAVYAFLPQILAFLRVPADVLGGMREYLLVIFAGLLATSIYNYLACLLRALGNSTVPLVFLAVSALLNVGLDLLFVPGLGWGISGAAWATVCAQYVSAAGLALYVVAKCKDILPKRSDLRLDRGILREIFSLSSLTCAQQSVMNFGLVNSFGATVMAAFAAGVKIDTFAYLPVQDFGNAYSTFVAQNFGAGNRERIREGTKRAFMLSTLFGCVISALVCALAGPLMRLFVEAGETAVIAAGVEYLRVEGAFYAGIGCLFLLYGYFRAVQRPGFSVVLTVVSLGTRVALAYAFAAGFGARGVWVSIPIGWALADLTGLLKMRRTLAVEEGKSGL